MAEDDAVLTRPAPAPDLRVSYGEHPDRVADVRPGDARAARRPLLVLLHGGFWRPAYDRAHTAPMAEALRADGWTVAAAEYRRVPGDPTATTDDVRAALLTLPGLITAPHDGRLIVIGHSAGGHLALWAAQVAPPPTLLATIALAPVADLRRAEELRLSNDAVRAFRGAHDGLDPVRLPTAASPVVLLHGADDQTVPPELSRTYAAAHPAARHREIPGAHHYSFIDPLLPHWPALVEELHRLRT